MRFPKLRDRPPRNLGDCYKTFKAEEFGSFLTRYLLPLSFGRVDVKTYRAFQKLVYVVSVAISWEIEWDELDTVERYLKEFLKWFYETIYQRKSERLAACKYTIHALCHLVDDIRRWGSASYFWQFTEVYRCSLISW